MTVKTRYGTVDETALQAFLDDFDTGSILQAVSNLDRTATPENEAKIGLAGTPCSGYAYPGVLCFL